MIALLILVTVFTFSPVTKSEPIPRVMEIVELDRATDIITCVDSVGFEWEFYGCEDYAKGDLVICMMNTKRTNCIFDDEIIDTYFSGYTFAPCN